MRKLRVLLPIAILTLTLMQPVSHASGHLQPSSHPHTIAARQMPVTFRPSGLLRHRALYMSTPACEPETVNPPTHPTVFSYVVNLVRGLFARVW